MNSVSWDVTEFTQPLWNFRFHPSLPLDQGPGLQVEPVEVIRRSLDRPIVDHENQRFHPSTASGNLGELRSRGSFHERICSIFCFLFFNMLLFYDPGVEVRV